MINNKLKSLINDKKLVFSSSAPAGNMIISTYYKFNKLNKKGIIYVEITEKTQDGRVIDRKPFYFKSNGENPGENGSNESFNKARQKAFEYSRKETHLWRNKKKYDELTPDEVEKLRKEGNVFWNDENIHSPSPS